MKILILCAGTGSRMLINYPKTLLKYNKQTILKKIYNNFIKSGITNKNIFFATGFKKNLIKKEIGKNVNYINNPMYASTNMVYTFMKAVKNIDDDILVSYSDLIYNKENIKRLIKNKNDFVTIVDKKWKHVWKKKKKLEYDSETLLLKKNIITELGKKTKNIKSIDARYVGLTKISREVMESIKKFYYENLKKNPKKFRKIDMTNFFNLLIKNGIKLYSLNIIGNWKEYDDEIDLNFKFK
jgi:choline kinase